MSGMERDAREHQAGGKFHESTTRFLLFVFVSTFARDVAARLTAFVHQ